MFNRGDPSYRLTAKRYWSCFRSCGFQKKKEIVVIVGDGNQISGMEQYDIWPVPFHIRSYQTTAKMADIKIIYSLPETLSDCGGYYC